VTSRERVLATLAGQRPDRVPVALGFRPSGVERFAPQDYSGPRPDVLSVSFKTSEEEVDFQKQVRRVPYDTRLGTPDLLATYRDWQYWQPGRDRNPLAAARSAEEILEFPFPDMNHPSRHGHIPDQVERLRSEGVAVAGGLPHLGGELFETAWRLRGLETWIIDLLERPDIAEALLDRIVGMCVANVKILARAGVDILVLDDDVGMPTTLIIGPDLWARYLRPRLAGIIAAAREVQPDLFVLYHSDGWIEPIIDGLIEIGVDALNPVQPDVMDPARIADRFGDRLTIWGGIGTQGTFAQRDMATVARQTRERIDTIGPERLVLCPAYDLVDNEFLWANVECLLRTAEAHG
jgi:uroporphyrinogen decarboxylase